jgi:hypothetical protein
MKANELMLGDWVLDTRTNNPLRVNPFMAMMEVPEWLPIPLTPKILEKNGFKLNEEVKDYYYIYYGIDDRVSLCNDKEYMNSDNEWHVHIDSEDYCMIASCELTYVHELQHLLKLCKINFEFVV